MRRIFQRSLILLVVASALGAYVAVVHATTGHLAQLPSSATLGCANCHAGATATDVSDTTLNLFGKAFVANGKVWNRSLAEEDSDKDGCWNGVELGDADGNGQPDGHQGAQALNPGVPGDCPQTNPLDEQSWSALKSAFNTGR